MGGNGVMGRRNLVEGASLSAYDAIFGGDDEEVMHRIPEAAQP